MKPHKNGYRRRTRTINVFPCVPQTSILWELVPNMVRIRNGVPHAETSQVPQHLLPTKRFLSCQSQDKAEPFMSPRPKGEPEEGIPGGKVIKAD